MDSPIEFDPAQLEKIEIERIRRNRLLSVEEILAQHDEAVRSVLECMRDADAAKVRRPDHSSHQ